MPKELAPAFQVYAAEFINDIHVQTMLPDELGVYFRLLCLCWIEDGLPNDPIVLEALAFGGSLSRLRGRRPATPEEATNNRSTDVHRAFNELWTAVSPRFYIDDSDGRLRNPRMEKERAKQRTRREKKEKRREQQVEAGRKSAESRKRTPAEQPSNIPSTPVERSAVSLSSSLSSPPSVVPKKKIKKSAATRPPASFSAGVLSIVDRLKILIEKKTRRALPSGTRDKWAVHIDKLHRLDGITESRQHSALSAYEANYGRMHWPEIQSGQSWRDKFQKLENAMTREKAEARNPMIPEEEYEMEEE